MKITRISGGPLPTNCYFLEEEASGAAAVVDPGFESDELSDLARRSRVEAILLTHGHFDHISGVAALQKLTGARVYLSSDELPFVRDSRLNLSGPMTGSAVPSFRVDAPLYDGDTVRAGNLEIRVMSTPGHTAGSCCFFAGDALFSGDTLMKLSCGRTDFPTGSGAQMADSLRRLAALKGDFRIYPGHGAATSLEFERQNNVFLGKR